MYKKTTLLLLAINLGLAACGTTTEQMRAKPKESGSFHVDLPYEQVKQSFLKQAEKCYRGGTPQSYFIADYRDLVPGESSRIELVQMSRLFEPRVMFSNDIKKNPAGGTDVDYFVGQFGIFSKHAPMIESWAKGEDKCHFTEQGYEVITGK